MKVVGAKVFALLTLVAIGVLLDACAERPRVCPAGWHPGPYGRRCVPDRRYPPPYLPPPGEHQPMPPPPAAPPPS
jgi:hypothetical protein